MQSGGEVKQLGLIFMSEADANALVEKVGLQQSNGLSHMHHCSLHVFRHSLLDCSRGSAQGSS